ncbi:RNA polymerase sigma factor [Mucilaginibacter paludis]|uniref:RNA polymerase, sigma-24 subunit, ECF subfamily n=1 Tax=Mucilaginibacter paludis DSM 18603 TaxID=714943 RepID=H1YA47_9SPHI|nr:sigma-70 family RNA polymerase sigma factor [Mucilaginibacter paludis]EHQ25928.1 RNA polymerase, sigma-24 subunit, ECF subfamily [Mucilaginibacter paludis DSM 18603]
MDNLSDLSLLDLMQHDDEQAFAVVVHRYRKQLYRQIYKRLGSEDDTKDLLQEIYLSLWNNRSTLVIKDSLLPYLSRAAHYTIVDQYLFRKKRTALEVSLALMDEPAYSPVEDIIMADDLKKEFERELEKMPLTVQHVFRLSRNEGLSVKEIAVTLNLSEQTVKNYISAALQALRVYLVKDNLAFVLALASACLFKEMK